MAQQNRHLDLPATYRKQHCFLLHLWRNQRATNCRRICVVKIVVISLYIETKHMLYY